MEQTTNIQLNTTNSYTIAPSHVQKKIPSPSPLPVSSTASSLSSKARVRKESCLSKFPYLIAYPLASIAQIFQRIGHNVCLALGCSSATKLAKQMAATSAKSGEKCYIDMGVLYGWVENNAMIWWPEPVKINQTILDSFLNELFAQLSKSGVTELRYSFAQIDDIFNLADATKGDPCDTITQIYYDPAYQYGFQVGSSGQNLYQYMTSSAAQKNFKNTLSFGGALAGKTQMTLPAGKTAEECADTLIQFLNSTNTSSVDFDVEGSEALDAFETADLQFLQTLHSKLKAQGKTATITLVGSLTEGPAGNLKTIFQSFDTYFDQVSLMLYSDSVYYLDADNASWGIKQWLSYLSNDPSKLCIGFFDSIPYEDARASATQPCPYSDVISGATRGEAAAKIYLKLIDNLNAELGTSYTVDSFPAPFWWTNDPTSLPNNEVLSDFYATLGSQMVFSGSAKPLLQAEPFASLYAHTKKPQATVSQIKAFHTLVAQTKLSKKEKKVEVQQIDAMIAKVKNEIASLELKLSSVQYGILPRFLVSALKEAKTHLAVLYTRRGEAILNTQNSTNPTATEQTLDISGVSVNIWNDGKGNQLVIPVGNSLSGLTYTPSEAWGYAMRNAIEAKDKTFFNQLVSSYLYYSNQSTLLRESQNLPPCTGLMGWSPYLNPSQGAFPSNSYYFSSASDADLDILNAMIAGFNAFGNETINDNMSQGSGVIHTIGLKDLILTAGKSFVDSDLGNVSNYGQSGKTYYMLTNDNWGHDAVNPDYFDPALFYQLKTFMEKEGNGQYQTEINNLMLAAGNTMQGILGISTQSSGWIGDNSYQVPAKSNNFGYDAVRILMRLGEFLQTPGAETFFDSGATYENAKTILLNLVNNIIPLCSTQNGTYQYNGGSGLSQAQFTGPLLLALQALQKTVDSSKFTFDIQATINTVSSCFANDMKNYNINGGMSGWQPSYFSMQLGLLTQSIRNRLGANSSFYYDLGKQGLKPDRYSSFLQDNHNSFPPTIEALQTSQNKEYIIAQFGSWMLETAKKKK
jgi:hypothetical protein